MKITRKNLIIIILAAFLGCTSIALTACKSKKKESAEEIDNTNYISAPQTAVLKTPALATSFVKTPTFTVQGVEAGDTVSLYRDPACQEASLLGRAVVEEEQNEVDITINALTEVGPYAIFAQRTHGPTMRSPCSARLQTYHLVGCPNEMYLPIEGNAELETSAFCIMRTEAKKGEDQMPISAYEGKPWASLNSAEAKQYCQGIEVADGSCDLISNPQWMTVAREIEANPLNWQTGEVGGGLINLGHCNYRPNMSTVIEDPTNYWDQDTSDSQVWEYRRAHFLNNGEVIWDLGGNVNEWVDWTTGGIVFTSGPYTCDGAWTDPFNVNCAGLQARDYLPANPAGIAENQYTASLHGVGKIMGTAEENRNSSAGGAAIRGGSWITKINGGIFNLNLEHGPEYTSTNLGFRCGCVVRGDGHTYHSFKAPTAVRLKTPAFLPSFSKTPTFVVSGVQGGDTVRLFFKETCDPSSLLGSAVVASGQTEVEVGVSLATRGNYPIYANRTNAAGETSICSSRFMIYQAVRCPNEFYLPVPGNAALGTGDFCVMKTEAKYVNSVAVAQYEGKPKVQISPIDAKTTCQNIRIPYTSCDLISNAQWMTIARNIESTAANWSGGEVGSGSINRGHSDNDPNESLSISDPTNPWDQTDPDGLETPWSQKRTHTLSNGSEIWDFAGNVHEWVDWDTWKRDYTLGPYSCFHDGTKMELYDVNCPALEDNDYLPGNPAGIAPGEYLAATYGIGKFSGTLAARQNENDGGGTHRSGSWSIGDAAGIFTVNFNVPKTMKANDGGYRCVCVTAAE